MQEKKQFSLLKLILKNQKTKYILLCLDKPKTISEITRCVSEKLNLTKNKKLSFQIKKLQKLNLVKILSFPNEKTHQGKILGLTKKGIEIATKIAKEEGENFEYKKLRNINWEDYAWCLAGTQKKAILKALKHIPQRQKEIREELAKFYRTRNFLKGKSVAIQITRGNLNDILQKMVKRGIVEIVTEPRKRKTPLKKYKLTEKGEKIKAQILC